jgi:uncharacterized protein YjbI with pentapeptide repeats
MRIIKPQQLAVIKSGYQLGQQSWLGVSVVAGFWLSKGAHFTTEAQIWQAWQDAAHGFPLLDCAEPKPCAEFLLAGSLSAAADSLCAEASVSVGPLTRHWRVEAERDEHGDPLPFSPCPLTHAQATKNANNPQGSSAPRLFSWGKDDELVAPAPVPHDFPLRQDWLSAVQAEMQTELYRDNIFPGLPASLDGRYFQLAPASQRLDAPSWPQSTRVSLSGFGSSDGDVALPDAQARCWFQRHGDQPEAVAMPLKTLWLLPDSGIVLMIFTGAVPLSHLLDDSITTLAVALDSSASPRAQTHFQQVIAKRSAAEASPFEFLYDPDLMPVNAALDAILFDAPAPEMGKPGKPAATRASYAKLREMMDKPTQVDSDTAPDLSGLPPLSFHLLPEELTATDQHEGQRFSLILHGNLSNKTFKDCHFKDCHFGAGLWQQLRFERCRFENCHWQGVTVNDSQFEQCLLTECHAADLAFNQLKTNDLQLAHCHFEGWHSTDCQWNNLLMQQCKCPSARFIANQFNGWTLDDSQMPNLVLEQTSTERALFRKTRLSEIAAYQWSLKKSSAMECNFSGGLFHHCEIVSLTCGLNCDFSSSEFSECVLNKVGLAKADLRHTLFSTCSVEESNADGALLWSSHVIACDMAGLRLQHAELQNTRWEKTSLQQACLYNANLTEAAFLACNLSGANLARSQQHPRPRFEECLLTAVCWLPRRKNSSVQEQII